MGRTGCTEPQCLYSRAIPLLPLWAVRPVQSLSACIVQLYLYSPYGPYSLYRASVPVQGCTLPFYMLAIHKYSRPTKSSVQIVFILGLHDPEGQAVAIYRNVGK